MRDFVGGVGHELNQHRFEADQQGVGCGVVRAQGLAIETGRVVRGQRKGAAVQHDVALDFANPQALQTTHQKPQLLHAQLGVATALHIHLSLQHAIAHRTIDIHRRAPGEGRPQHIQRCTGGDQLHQRRRVARHLGLVSQPGGGQRVHRQHHHAQGLARQLGALQRILHLGWQHRGLRLCGGDQQHARATPAQMAQHDVKFEGE